ncbi:MAG: hypothetical protein QNK82_13520 [Akkermansiaceae bacterium]
MCRIGDGSWQELPGQYAFINSSSRRTSFTLTKVPPGTYKSFRFSLGVPKKENHGDPAQYSADHPIAGLQLSKEDQVALVAFLQTLAGPKF